MDNQGIAIIVMYAILKNKIRHRKLRKCWVREWIKRRDQLGVCSSLGSEMRIEDAQQFRSFIRMSSEQLEIVINLVAPEIMKQDTRLRSAIPVKDRVMVTLRFLASGDSYGSLQYLFRIPVCTIGRIIAETTAAFYNRMKDIYLKFPSTNDEWLSIAESFHDQWNFPHCLGALDGKHVAIKAPDDSGSLYFNYKHSHSIVLMAITSADYKLVYIDVGFNGGVSDSEVFQNSSLYKALEEKQILLPKPIPLPGRTLPVPYVFVADNPFYMKSHILKPYPLNDQPPLDRIFNQRLSRAHCTVDKVFKIMANQFRVLRKPINLHPKKATNIVLAICTLHNFLIAKKELAMHYLNQMCIDYENPDTYELAPVDCHEEAAPENTYFALEQDAQHGFSIAQKNVRDEFTEYFMTSVAEV